MTVPTAEPPQPDPATGYPTTGYPAQGYPATGYPAQAYPAQAYPAQAYPAQAYPAQVFPADPYAGAPAEGLAPAPPRRRRRGGLVISLVLAAVALLCAGGGVGAYLLVQDAQPRGGAVPKAAIEGFLTAVFTDHSAQAAAAYVCPAARDEEQLARLVSQVKTFAEKFDTPRTTWAYPPVQATGRQAEATITLTLETANEQVATKRIRLLLVDDRGWWVCDAEAAG